MKRDQEDSTETHMRQVLEHEAFKILRVLGSSHKTADFRVSDESHRYLIEVKRKEDNPERIAKFEQDFLETSEAVRNEPAGRTNILAGIIEAAAQQLQAMGDPEEFRLIWFVAMGATPELQIDQFRSTLYGEVPMILTNRGTTSPPIPCYYYSFSKFFDLQQIDGAIAATPQHGVFYLNTFSEKAPELRLTKLFKMFEARAGAIDPAAKELAGEALILDGAVDRRDKAACYASLLRKSHSSPRSCFH